MISAIDAGTMTLSNLSEIVNCNIAQANIYKIKLSWCFEDGKICGRVKRGSLTVWKKYYEGEHIHILLARMNWDFSCYINKLGEAFRAERDRKEVESWKTSLDSGKFAMK